MAWTDAVLHLQEIDQRLDEIRERRQEIQAILGDDEAVKAARAEAASLAEAADEARKAQEEAEFELDRAQRQRRINQRRLYSGDITNARELQDLQAESESLQRRVSMLEDRVLEAMMLREEADEAAQAATERLQILLDARAQQHADLQAEREALDAEAASLREAREAIRAQLPDSILTSYDYLWARTDGLPVAQLHRGICSVCGLEVLKPIQQKVQRGEEAYCDSCRRLIVS